MPLVDLSASFVRKAKCPSGRRKVDFFDQHHRGFLLEVRCSGGRTYYQRYTDERGRERQFKIGSAGVLSLQQAMKQARRVLAQVTLGADPQKNRERLRAIPRLSSFVHDQYLPFVRSYKRSWRTDETILRLHILTALGTKHVDEIGGQNIAALLQKLRADGYGTGTTNRVLVLLRFMFNLGRKWDVPGFEDNPTSGLSTAPDVQRDRFLTAEEAHRLVVALKADENQVAAQAIILLLLTGARRNEITQAKWEYLNWNKRTLLVPVSKSGKPRLIVLNAPAISLLRNLDRRPDNPFIFPSSVSGRPPPSLFFPWDRIRRRAFLEDVRLHDLRHSFASFLVNQGVSLYVVQGLLGHLHARTTQRYAHLSQGTLLDAAELVGPIVIAPPSAPSPPGAHADYEPLPT